MSLIRLENVSLARQGKTLLSGLNWTVEKGQTWAILGLNGAGKSTLLRLLTAESQVFVNISVSSAPSSLSVFLNI